LAQRERYAYADRIPGIIPRGKAGFPPKNTSSIWEEMYSSHDLVIGGYKFK